MHCYNRGSFSRKQNLESKVSVGENWHFTYDVSQDYNPNTVNADWKCMWYIPPWTLQNCVEKKRLEHMVAIDQE